MGYTDVRLTHVMQDGSGKVKGGERCSWGCCQCLCLCSFQTSLEMKDVLLLTTTPPPPGLSFSPFSLPDFSFIALTHELILTLNIVFECSSSATQIYLFIFHVFLYCHTTQKHTLNIRNTSVLQMHFYQEMLVWGHLHNKQASKPLQPPVLKAQVCTVSSAPYLFISQLY